MKWMRLALATTGLVAAIVPTTMATASAAPSAQQQPVAVPKLTWRACDNGFQCSTARVPLDYRRPGGSKISLALIRHLATARPARRLGTMFINFGGPMEQFEPFLSGFSAIPAALRERYDIVAFDPRGFGFSTAVRCFSSVAAENKFLGGLPPFPVGPAQDAAWERTWARFDALCARRNGSLLDHVATADTARDLNLLRQAVGARKLNYLGASYGTVLGAVYANLFPATTGHMVLDGNLDPVAWSRGSLPASLRLGQDLSTSATLRSYLDLCGQAPTSACPFSAGTPSATEAKFARLEQIVRRHPVMFGNPPKPITLADLLVAIPLGDVNQWQGSTGLLQQFWLAATSSSGSAGAASPGFPARAAASGGPYTGIEQTYAVSCADQSEPRNVGAYSAAARLAQARSGGYGLFFTWTDEPCARWPGSGGQDRYAGPWNRSTASTILLVNLTGDPLTSYQDAVAMSRDLAKARLLTVAGWGHTELANPSDCAIRYEVGYLTTGALPPAGTVCAQNGGPFPVP